MASKGRAFAGVTVALATPFRSGEVDTAALLEAVDWQIAQGTLILSPVGTTGEAPTLSHDEHERVIGAVIERAAGRAKVVPGTGSNATSEAVRLSRFAAKAGADAALVVAPYYNRPTQEGLYAHFAKVAESCGIPVILYNVPGRTGRNIEPETVERLAKVRLPSWPLKEASGSLDQVSDVLGRTDLTVLSGDDSLTLPMLAVGAEGVVSVAANSVPKEVIGMVNMVRSGEIAAARSMHAKLFPLCRDLLSLGPNPIPIKTAIALLGRGNGEMRLPMTPLEPKARETLRATLTRFGLTTVEL